MPQYDYDVLVIGSGPSGQRAAIQSAKLHKRVAIVERKAVVGGVCVNSGTIPSKTMREAVLHLSGYRYRSLYGASYTVKQNITIGDLTFRTGHVVNNEIEVMRHQLMRNGIDVIVAEAEFLDPHTARLVSIDGRGHRDVTFETIILAAGTHAGSDDHIPFDGQRIFTSDDVLTLDKLPRTLTVVGAGVIGCEFACIFATLGVRVTLVDKRDRLLPFVDREITDALTYRLRENRVTIRLNEEVSAIEPITTEHGDRVRILLGSGKQILTDQALYSIGRRGATDTLNLEAAGLSADSRGRLKVNGKFQTAVPHIYAVGDLIGFPSLASTSMEQGRLAACHAAGVPAQASSTLFPYGIYTIPEISMVGRTEEELTDLGVPYEIGTAHYREIARGQILGDQSGLLKLIFHVETRQVLGVHIIGEGASELVHIGQAVMAFGGTVDYFVDAVFNYPTLAECYKTAGFNGINRLTA
ncbi:MAG: Si-specific NAD(P)(+) transhydrogenase [Chloroflexota bacterium]